MSVIDSIRADAGHAPSHFALRSDLYQDHLDRVSRSFALCIQRLNSPLREHVGMAYLLCRVVDTIEDAGWESERAQLKSFQEFDSFISENSTPSGLAKWESNFPTLIPDGERALLRDMKVLISDFHQLPSPIAKILKAPILSMSAGMQHFIKRKWSESVLRLKNLRDVNLYCFFVAGVVGEILCGLTGASPRDQSPRDQSPRDQSPRDQSPGEPSSGEVHRCAIHFGLFLQKINLLKDQAQDEQEGRYLVPNRPELRASLLHHARKAIQYIRAIDETRLDFRVFCAWSLFLGLASLPQLDRNYSQLGTGASAPKIPRAQAEELFRAVEGWVADNEKLTQFFDELVEEAFSSQERSSPASSAVADHGGGGGGGDHASSSGEVEVLEDFLRATYSGQMAIGDVAKIICHSV